MSMRTLGEMKTVASAGNRSRRQRRRRPLRGAVVIKLVSVGLLTFPTYSPDLRPPTGYWTLRRSLEGNGKAATVSALLRRRFLSDSPFAAELLHERFQRQSVHYVLLG